MFGGLNVYGGYKGKEWIWGFTLFLCPKISPIPKRQPIEKSQTKT
jgi:hypothetical protein